jgi:hypothetical protein
MTTRARKKPTKKTPRKSAKKASRKMPTTKEWRDYELIVKAIYEALIRPAWGVETASAPDQLEVHHNAKVKGIHSRKHQVDVYVKFPRRTSAPNRHSSEEGEEARDQGRHNPV